jgi:hypothetical protein
MVRNKVLKREPMTQETDYSGASSDDLPNHFDDLIDNSGGDDGGNGDEPPTPSVDMLDQEAFHALFCVGFNTASTITKLQSLAVNKDDDGCINCTRAIYDTIYDIPMLHFMLKPSGKWMERALAIGMFTVPMAMGVSQELAIRKAQAKPQQEIRPAIRGTLNI